MSASSELVALARLNGDFQKHYGKLIGALLYLRSISAAQGRPPIWMSLAMAALWAAVAWLEGHGAAWFHTK